MINHHGQGVLARLADTIHVWRQRYQLAPRTGPVVRAGPARRRHLLERCRLRGRKTVLAGLSSSQAGVASSGGRRPISSRATGASDDHDCVSTISGNIRTCCARGTAKPVTVRFVEPRDAEALQNYFRSLNTGSRYNRFPRRDQRIAAVRARGFHPYRRSATASPWSRPCWSMVVRPSSAKRATPLTPIPPASNSACRSTTAGRATASARRC